MKYFTSAEIELLREYYYDAPKTKLLDMFSPRTWKSLKDKASRLGVHRSTMFHAESARKIFQQYNAIPEVKEAKRKMMSRFNKDTNFLRRKTEGTAKLWANADFRIKNRKAVIAAIKNNPERGRKISQYMSGKCKSAEHRKHLSESRIGMPNPNPRGWGVSGKRADLGNQFFRSRWEANFARVLDYLRLGWVYEPRRFYGDGCSLLIDFYIPVVDKYFEVKGWMKESEQRKLSIIKTANPEAAIGIVGKKEYSFLTQLYKKFIPNWEN